MCLKKCILFKNQRERRPSEGGREGGTTESDGYLYSVGEILSKHKGIGIRLKNIQYGVKRKRKLLVGASQLRQF